MRRCAIPPSRLPYLPARPAVRGLAVVLLVPAAVLLSALPARAQITSVHVNPGSGSVECSSSSGLQRVFQLDAPPEQGAGTQHASVRIQEIQYLQDRAGQATVESQERLAQVTLDIQAGNCAPWTLAVHARRAGLVQAGGELGYGWARAELGAAIADITGSSSGVELLSGDLDLGQDIALENYGTDELLVEWFDDESSAILAGVGSQTVRLRYRWTITLESSPLSGVPGDPSGVMMGMTPDWPASCGVQYSGPYTQSEAQQDGLFVEFDLEYTPCPTPYATASETVVCGGQQIELRVHDAPPCASFRWLKDGQPTSGYSATFIQGHQESGQFTCEVSSPACGLTTTAPIAITVLRAPQWTQYPDSVTLCASSTPQVVFSMSATGDALLYEWLDSMGRVVATGQSLVMPVDAGTAGVYRGRISNACGTLDTGSLVLAMKTPPVLVSEPTSRTLCASATSQLVFSAGWSGSQPITMRWYGPGPAFPLVGTSDSLSMVVTPAKAGAYYFQATNDCGTVTSALVTLTVPQAPTVQVSASRTMCEFDNYQTIFTATAQGESINGLQYTWFGPGPQFHVAGHGAELRMNVEAEDTGSYYCRVNNGCQSTNSALVTLTVLEHPTIPPWGRPQSTTLCASSTPQTVFTVAAEGGDLHYEWFGPAPTQLRGTGAALVLAEVTAADAGSYFVRISNGCGPPAQSSLVTLQVSSAAPEITSAPQSIAPCDSPNPQALFSVVASGAEPLTYTWYGPDGTVKGTGPSLTFAPTGAVGGQYRVEVSNVCGTASATATLTIRSAPAAVAATPSSQSACGGATVVFQADTPDPPGVTYSWFRRIGNVANYVGSGNTLVLPGVGTSATGGYCIVALSDCGSSVGPDSTLVVEPPAQVAIAISPDPLVTGFCAETPVTLTANVSGLTGSYTCRWFKDSASNCVGEGTALNIVALDASAIYWAEVSSASGCSTTSGPVDLSTGQDALWTGPTGSSFLAAGSWRRLLEQVPQCGAWQGTSSSPGVCPPLRFGRLKNTGATSDAAVLNAGQRWSMRQLEIEGGGSSARRQRLELAAGADLRVSQGTPLLADGELVLDDATATLGDLRFREGGALIGRGIVGANAELENHGLILAQGPTGTDLVLVPDQGSLHLRCFEKSVLRAAAGSAGLTLLGSLWLDGSVGIVPVTPAKLEVEPDASVVVMDDVTNWGLVKVQGSGPGSAGELWFRELVNNIGSATCASCPNLYTGVWLQGGELHAIGPQGRLVNSAPGKVHATATSRIGARFENSGKLKVNGAGTVLTVQGCFQNGAGGVVQLDAGTTLILDNQSHCRTSDNLGAITTFGPGICIGCAGASAGPALLVSGDLVNGPDAQLVLGHGLLQVSGDLRSEITEPYDLDLGAARVVLTGMGPQELVLAGPDLGALGDFGAREAMSIGELVVGAGAGPVTLAPRPDGSPSVLYARRIEIADGATLELGTSTVYAAEVSLQPGAMLALDAGRLFYGSIDLVDPCASGQVLGAGCATQLAPMPAADCAGDGIADGLEIANGTEPDCNQNGVPDACDLVLGSALDQDRNGLPDDCQMLHADRPWLSASRGGRQTLELHAGIVHAGRPYVLSGATKGTRPGTLGGAALSGSSFSGALGVLDAQGRAAVAIELEAGQLDASLVGSRFHHRFQVVSGGNVVATSNPTTLEIRP